MDYESIDKTEFRVVVEELEGEPYYNEIENMLEEQPRGSDQSTKLSEG